MDKNGLGKDLPSRNNTIGKNPKITTAAGAPVSNNQDTKQVGKEALLY